MQPQPEGLAAGLHHRPRFHRRRPCALVLGDNIFYGHGLPELLQRGRRDSDGATVFAYQVTDPERYGVVEFDARGKARLDRGEADASRSRTAR